MERPGRNTALDGVRGLAAVAIVVQHTASPLPALWIGVDVFFVLSGYLITTLLVRELAATGGVCLAGFYLRRAARLIPPLLPVLALGLWWDTVHGQHGATSTLATLFYVQNWWLSSFPNQFEVVAMGHAWSLSIEEQFYLLWPLLATLAWRRAGLRGVGIAAAAGGLLSLTSVAALSLTASSPIREVFGTDTRGGELLIGCALAVLAHSGRLPRVGRATTVACGLALLALATAGPGSGSGPVTLLTGYAAAAVAAVLIASVMDRSDGVLGSAPLVYLGSVSYAVYLWHYPISLILAPPLGRGLALLGATAAVTFAAAEVSRRWIETPCRRAARRVRFAPLRLPAAS